MRVIVGGFRFYWNRKKTARLCSYGSGIRAALFLRQAFRARSLLSIRIFLLRVQAGSSKFRSLSNRHPALFLLRLIPVYKSGSFMERTSPHDGFQSTETACKALPATWPDNALHPVPIWLIFPA